MAEPGDTRRAALYPRPHMRYDVVVVGAAPGRVRARGAAQRGSGADGVPRRGRARLRPPCRGTPWPADILDPRALAFSHDWGVGGEDSRSLGSRIVGGSSAHNACMVIWGAPSDYDEWGDEWSFGSFSPYLERATAQMCTTAANTDRPAPPHDAFLEAAQHGRAPPARRAERPRPARRRCPPAQSDVGGVRWSCAFAYLEAARGRGQPHRARRHAYQSTAWPSRVGAAPRCRPRT